MSLQQGFETLFSESGRKDVVVFLRPGATSEGESFFPRSRVEVIKKSLPEIAVGPEGPLVSGELFCGVRMKKIGGGETNVPIRGVEQATFRIFKPGALAVTPAGRPFTPGTDEVIVGRSLVARIDGCSLGEVILLNTTPFRVVGIFDCEGPFKSEIWGDINRLGDAMQRPGYSRLIARLKDGTDLKALQVRMEENRQVQAKVLTEREYLTSQTAAISWVLIGLGTFLAVIMGAAAVFTGTNTMLAALAARSHEIGILLAIGFRPFAIFLSFLFEALLLGLLGGLVGCLLVLPVNGVNTGTTNFISFTEIAFAFRVTPRVLITANVFAIGLGLLGGLLPAWHAASKSPTEALRRR
jgi:putative ABC transport system permease protein